MWPTDGLPEDATVHLDSGYDDRPSRDVLAAHGLVGEIAPKGKQTPVQIPAQRGWAG